ncbi:inhibitor of growth protein 4-like [Sycon ciliatum]|uniref:inhibitor of growth protein 4-like n=1 Tax=Sycon ciliatum TaxID=27933 RepID=UPI0020AD5112|eukprot:scpid77810/ scgid29305/ Inhibitor of growth protein 4; p29ING4
MSSMYLERYLEGVESLPLEVQRNFTLMRELDQRVQGNFSDINGLSSKYISDVKTLSSSTRNKRLTEIQDLYSKARELADEKVQLAAQTYELVDKHIRRLDGDLNRFETELRKKEAEQGDSASTQAETPSRKSIEPQRKRAKNSQSSDTGASTGVPSAAEVLDMPVDPNEPTYCVCHQVSYGEMIGCDNPDCPVEWFHFACVGLSSKPKGKWYCTRCSQDRKKK